MWVISNREGHCQNEGLFEMVKKSFMYVRNRLVKLNSCN